jgi:hypothetical protein
VQKQLGGADVALLVAVSQELISAQPPRLKAHDERDDAQGEGAEAEVCP